MQIDFLIFKEEKKKSHLFLVVAGRNQVCKIYLKDIKSNIITS